MTQVIDLQKQRRSKGGITWAYGVTTVPSRKDTLLPQTLASLAAAGFDAPQVFLDGCIYGEGFGPDTTIRFSPVGAYGNFVLSLAELWMRNPHADRFALFEDDILICKNTKAYLDRLDLPSNAFWNLYTAPEKQTDIADGVGFSHPKEPRCRGALALVFPNQAVLRFFTEDMEPFEHPTRNSFNKKNQDGLVSRVMKRLKVRELLHNPSLVQHVGEQSVLREDNSNYPSTVSTTFLGADFDALHFLAVAK